MSMILLGGFADQLSPINRQLLMTASFKSADLQEHLAHAAEENLARTPATNGRCAEIFAAADNFGIADGRQLEQLRAVCAQDPDAFCSQISDMGVPGAKEACGGGFVGFLKRYKWPLLGGVAAVGLGAFVLTRKKGKR